jgi:hypothetical protein
LLFSFDLPSSLYFVLLFVFFAHSYFFYFSSRLWLLPSMPLKCSH